MSVSTISNFFKGKLEETTQKEVSTVSNFFERRSLVKIGIQGIQYLQRTFLVYCCMVYKISKLFFIYTRIGNIVHIGGNSGNKVGYLGGVTTHTRGRSN